MVKLPDSVHVWRPSVESAECVGIVIKDYWRSDSAKLVGVATMHGAVTGSGRSGGFDVAKNDSVQATISYVDSPSTVPKFRTIISIQPDDQPSRSSPIVSVSAPPSNGLEVTNGPTEQVSIDGADPDDTESVASSASSSSRTPWTTDRQNGHVRSPSSASSAASLASYRFRPPGSYVSPTSPRRDTTDVDDQHRQLVDHPFFALFRDSPYEESQILSGRGTVRGVRNRVKSGIAVFIEKHDLPRQMVSLPFILPVCFT